MSDHDLAILSKDVHSLASEFSLLSVFAKDQQKDLASHAVQEMHRILEKCYVPFQGVKDQFARARRSPAPLSVCGVSYASAHAATLEESNRFSNFLWFHLDRKGNEAANGENIRTGYDADLVGSEWEQAKAVILDRCDDQWSQDFREVPTLIEMEIADLQVMCPVAGGLELPTQIADEGLAERAPENAGGTVLKAHSEQPESPPEKSRRHSKWELFYLVVDEWVEENGRFPTTDRSNKATVEARDVGKKYHEQVEAKQQETGTQVHPRFVAKDGRSPTSLVKNKLRQHLKWSRPQATS